MFKKMQKALKRAFTITELVIVIAVIAILAAVLIPTFTNVIENANKSAALQTCHNALQDYQAIAAGEGEAAEADGMVFVSDGYAYVYLNGQLQYIDKLENLLSFSGNSGDKLTSQETAEGFSFTNDTTNFASGSMTVPTGKVDTFYIRNRDNSKTVITLTTGTENGELGAETYDTDKEKLAETLYFYHLGDVNGNSYSGIFSLENVIDGKNASFTTQGALYSRVYAVMAESMTVGYTAGV